VSLLEARGLEKSFGWRAVLRGVDLELGEGEVAVLFGPNGAGKSTLLRLLAGLSRPSRGRVLFRGQPWEKDPFLFRRSLGVVSHGPFLYPHLTGEENLVFFGRLFGLDRPERRARELLEAFGLSLFGRDPVSTYSRGMVQRLALARALLHRPSLLLLDEPFTGLDEGGRSVLGSFIRSFREGGGTALLVSHDIRESLSLADRYLVLEGGRITREGRAEQAPEEEIAALVGRRGEED